nr:MAG TPA: hypothetical protein [Caudoviricetes sp.]
MAVTGNRLRKRKRKLRKLHNQEKALKRKRDHYG